MPETSALEGQYLTMGFEGKFFIGPKGCTSHTDPAMILADSVRNPKYSYKYSEVDATLRRHEGIKAYMKGLLDVSVSFTLPNLKNDAGGRPADVALMLESMQTRRTPITIIMLDEEDGEGLIGDFELLGGDKSEEDDNLQEWEIEAKPSAAGRKVKWYKAPATPTP